MTFWFASMDDITVPVESVRVIVFPAESLSRKHNQVNSLGRK